ncbi:MAG: ketopantoate reductase C-terminal domain-containing protein, partial [Gemmatimonadales bacterium]
LDRLDARFGGSTALGGQCFISASLGPGGEILHLNDRHALSFGERAGGVSARVRTIAAAMEGARFDARVSEGILQEMWEKWMFIAAAAGITCLMRAPIGDIVAAGGAGLALELFDECAAIGAASGHEPSADFRERTRGMLSEKDSTMAASMLRDIERSARTEADHILGDLLRRRSSALGDQRSLLQVAFTHLEAYEARRIREAAGT